MTLISDMQQEETVRMDRWTFIGAYMAARLQDLYGQQMFTHQSVCELAYHEAAAIYENLASD